MKYYCTHCQEHVLTVSQDIEDTTYEYCPLCLNDLNLVESAGQPSKKEMDAAIVIEPSTNHLDFAQWQAKELELEKKQDRAIDAYHNALDSGYNREDAEKEYFTTLKTKH